MKLKFIGTSSGRTSLDRFHTSFIFNINSKNILIDCGDGISKALLSQGISYNSVTDIILTHYHSDHLAGLPSLLTQMIIQNRKEILNIYTHKNLVKPLNNFLDSSFLFLENLKFPVAIIGFEFNKKFKIINDFSFLPRQNTHITNKHNLKKGRLKFISSSFLFFVGANKIIYTSDVGSSEDLYLFQETQADIFITETTHISFLDIEAASIILSPNKFYLTHIDNEEKTCNWFMKLSSMQEQKFVLANDGMEIILQI